MPDEVSSIHLDPVVRTLLQRLLELERQKQIGVKEAPYAEHHANQPNLEGAHGVIYFAAPHMALLVVLCVLAGMALMGAVASLWVASRASTHADVLQLEVESFKNVLHAHKLPTAEHLPGESP